MHLSAATASAALARLPLQIFCSRKAKDYGECDLECVHMPMHVEVCVIADARKIGEGRRIKICASRISARRRPRPRKQPFPKNETWAKSRRGVRIDFGDGR
jgi:hypothetical protein